MRAVVCTAWGGPETLLLQNLPDPVPQPGEVLVQILAAGVNFPDVLIIQKKYQVQPEFPFIPGAEISGRVLALGEGVKHFAVGDRIVALCQTGGFAEKITVDARKCMKIPDMLEDDIAAGFLLAYGTSWHAVRDRAALQPSETLLVLGAAGGVGLAAVEIGKASAQKSLQRPPRTRNAPWPANMAPMTSLTTPPRTCAPASSAPAAPGRM